MDFPKTAEVVIIGGGAVGASTAYYLSKSGEKMSSFLKRIQSDRVLPGAVELVCAPSGATSLTAVWRLARLKSSSILMMN